MKKVLVDSSSLILLHKSGLLKDLYPHYQLLAAASVIAEVTQAGKPGAETAARMAATGEMKVLETMGSAPSAADTEQLLPLGCGERQTILAYLHAKGDFILVDDLKAIQFCVERKLPFINALLVPRILLLSGNIDRTRCEMTSQTILALGRYSPEIVQKAALLHTGELRIFFP